MKASASVRFVASTILGLVWCDIGRSADLQAPPPPASLRCDPGVDIAAIDGDTHRHALNVGYSDCLLDLTPGDHSVDVCYNVEAVFNPSTTRYLVRPTCKSVRRLELTSESGRIYRAKIDLRDLIDGADDWKAWIADVTPEEAGIPDKSPVANKSRRDVPGGERKSILLMQIDPPSMYVLKENGNASGIWFSAAGFGGNFFRSKDPDGWSTRGASMGDTFAITIAMQENPGSIFVRKTLSPCTDYRVPVFEDVPGGRALYLGRFRYEPSPAGVKLKFSQDGIEDARRYVDAKIPEWSGRVEVASYRMLRSMSFCFFESPENLVNDDGVVPPSIPVNREAAPTGATP